MPETGSAQPAQNAPATSGESPAFDIPLHRLDPDALKVVQRLRQYGHQAYFVGGCVRDLLVGCTPKDYDVATSAHPGEIRSIFRNCRLIGRRFRLAHVYFRGGKTVEVATFRKNPTATGLSVEPELSEIAEADAAARAEGVEEGAEPSTAAEPDLLITEDNVFGTAEEDAVRRDFTINGLFYDVSLGRVLDYAGGRRDLEGRMVRTIGDPEVRMREDPVRLLRAVRFASRLDFDLDPSTYAAMEGAVEDLPRCAPPRLLEEVFRLLRSGACRKAFELLRALGALKVLLPPVEAHLEKGGLSAQVEVYGFLTALDKLLAEGQTVDDSLLLSALLLPLMRAAPAEGAEGEGEGHSPARIDSLLADLVRTARLPRRIAERTRTLVSMQRLLSGEKRRRRPLGSIRRHPAFAEALKLLELSVQATGQNAERLEQWKRPAPAGPHAEAAAKQGAAEPADSSAAPRRRRRRRRRRGKSAGAEGGGSGETK